MYNKVNKEYRTQFETKIQEDVCNAVKFASAFFNKETILELVNKTLSAIKFE